MVAITFTNDKLFADDQWSYNIVIKVTIIAGRPTAHRAYIGAFQICILAFVVPYANSLATIAYVSNHFGQYATCVFDGYDKPDCTKRSEQDRQVVGNIYPSIVLNDITSLSKHNKKEFLNNREQEKLHQTSPVKVPGSRCFMLKEQW